ncbi:MAG: YfhO family protein [Thermoanaerobaculia bacterium]
MVEARVSDPPREILVPWKETLAVSLGYLCLLAAAYFNVFFQGKSLVYSNNYNPFDSRFLAQNLGEGFVPRAAWEQKHLFQYANFHDPGAAWWQWEPATEFLRQGIRDRELPLWDPYVGGGTQALANLTSALFYPPYLLVVLAGNTVPLKNFYFLAALLGTGLFTYLFLRKHDLSRQACFLGGLVFIFCGAITQNVADLIGQAAECLPLALFLTRRFLDRPTRGRVLSLAAGFAMIALASFPPVLIGLFAFTAAYAAVSIFAAPAPEPHRRRRLIAGFSVACVLGVGMVAFCYVPFLALMRATPQFAKIYRHAALGTVEPANLYQLFSPALLGGTKIFNRPLLNTRYLPELPYVGVAAIAIALLAGAPRKKTAGLLFAVTLGSTIVLVLKLLGVEPVQSLGHLPILNHVHVAHYFGIFLDFAIAIFAAFGLDQFVSGRATGGRIGSAVAVLGVALLGLYTTAQASGAGRSQIPEVWRAQARLSLFFAVMAGGALLAGMALRSPQSRRLLGAALILLCSVEGISYARYPRQKAWDIWRHPVPYVRQLQRTAGMDRTIGVAAMPADGGSAFGIFQLESLMSFDPPRIYEAYRRYCSPGTGQFLRGDTLFPSESFLDRANVKFIIAQDAVPEWIHEAESRNYETVFSDGFVRMFQRKTLPRYFFTSSYEIASSSRALALLDKKLPEKEILLEEPPGVPAAPNEPADAPVEVREFRRNSYALHFLAPRPGLVYCSESYFPGWTATVNGKPAKILAADYAFRAVAVPAGPVDVRFAYWPRGLTPGLLISGLSVLAAAGYAVFPLLIRRRRGEVL